MLNTVAIIGMGLLGGSLGKDLIARKLAARVIGIVRRPEAVQECLSAEAVHTATLDLSAIASADVVVLAAPVATIVRQMTDIAPYVRPDAVVTDMGSTKGAIVQAGESALGGRFVGGHPMAGSHKAGVSAARVNLFDGATWVFTPTERTDPKALEKAVGMASAVGARTVCLNVEDHDRIAASVSHMPHVVAAALTLAIDRLADGDSRFQDLAGGGLRDMTRLAASPAVLWRDILSANRENTITALSAFAEELTRAVEAMREDDDIESLFDRAAEARTHLVRE